MHQNEQHYDGHADEVREPCALEIVEEPSQRLELDRLPDGEPRHKHQNRGEDHADIEELLNGVIDPDVVVGEVEAQRLPGCRE